MTSQKMKGGIDMAMKEARCTNCGSILMADPLDPTVKCMFCRAVVDTQEAMAVAADPSGYVYPNEPQPDEETSVNAASLYNRALKQAQGGKPNQGGGPARTSTAKKAPPRPVSQADSAPRAQVEKIEMPSPKLSGAAKIKIAVTLAVLLLLTTAAVLPVTLVRDAHRSSIAAGIAGVIPFEYSGSDAYAIAKTGNTYFSVVSKKDVDAKTALAVFRSYCETRAAVYGLKPADDSFARVYGRVTVRVIGPNGGFEVTGLKSIADLQDPGKVREMG
jgi:hypothetical protein